MKNKQSKKANSQENRNNVINKKVETMKNGEKYFEKVNDDDQD